MSAVVCLLVLGGPAQAQQGFGDRLVKAAEGMLGEPYVFGGRAGRRGCRREGKRVRCREGIDCQSLLFFAFEKVTGRRWYRFSVMPSINVRRGELGRPVPGLEGVRREQVDPKKLRRGDVLFFLLEGYNLEADPPLLPGLGVWHTGMVHSAGERPKVIHAKPGAKVVIEALDAVAFDALFVLRPKE